MAATRNASRWSIARLFGKAVSRARGKKGFGDMSFLPFMGLRTYMVTPGAAVWMDRDYAKFALEGYIRNVIAHRCIGMVAGAAASVPVKLFSTNRRGVRRQIAQHPLLQLLSHPNPAQAHASFMEAIYQYRLIAGNGFVQAIGPNGSVPQELHVLRPDRVAIIAGKNGQPAAYRYTVNGEYKDFKIDPVTWASRILHLKTFHPLNDWYGLSPIEAVAYSIDQHNQAGAWNQALLQNGARPSGALVVKGADGQPGSLSEDQYYRLKAQIDEQFSGPVNAGRPMLLEGGLDWKELSLSPKDMDFIQSKNTSARDIALGFGVPPQMLGIPGDNTYSNLQEARLALWEQTIVPLVRSVIHSIGHWLAPMFDNALELCPDFDGVPALATKNQALWTMVQNASFLTDNEKRAAVGYPPVPVAPIVVAPEEKLNVVRSRASAGKPRRVKDDGADGDSSDDGDGGNSAGFDDLDTGSSTDSGGGAPFENTGQAPSYEDATVPSTWANPDLDEFNRHYSEHGDDFGASSWDDYADQANQLYQKYQDEDLPAIQYPDGGETGVYDPQSNTFGVYTPDGLTQTFYKPTSPTYFQRESDDVLSRGGSIINPIPDDTGGGGGMPIGRTDLLHPFDPLNNDGEQD